MNNEANLHAYDDVEKAQLELPYSDLKEYYSDKIESAKSDIVFITTHLFGGDVENAISVCEIGCGNGKLLCGLENKKVLRYGRGYEVSRSRWELAKRFCEIGKSEKIDIINGNFLDYEDSNQYDVIVMVDIVFQMICNLYNGALDDTINWIKEHLSEKGKVFLEIEDMSSSIETLLIEGEEKYWFEFQEPDPYIYGLFRRKLQNEKNVIIDKIFIKRTDHAISKTRSVWRSFSKSEIKEILEKYGFHAKICNYYNSKEEKDIDKALGQYNSNIFRVIGEKR